MRSRAVLVAAAMLAALVGCGSSAADVATPAVAASAAGDSVINWQTLGCVEPAALVVETSDALETDVGLAAGSLAETYDITVEEAQRRLRLQEVLGQAMADVQVAEAGRVARSEFQHQPTYVAAVTLTGARAISDATRDILCRTPELEVRLGASFTQDELASETVRLGVITETCGCRI